MQSTCTGCDLTYELNRATVQRMEVYLRNPTCSHLIARCPWCKAEETIFHRLEVIAALLDKGCPYNAHGAADRVLQKRVANLRRTERAKNPMVERFATQLASMSDEEILQQLIPYKP